MLSSVLPRPLLGLGIFLLLGVGLFPISALAQDDVETLEEPVAPALQTPPTQPTKQRPVVTAQGMPNEGPVSFGMESFDSIVPQFLAKWDIPGASLAIVKNERLIFARSYGLANVETGEKMQPQSRFRLASVSKVITATAILQLIDAGKLSLDDRVLDILPDLKPLPGQSIDPRLPQVTVQHLLQHTAGWERKATPEVTYVDAAVVKATGLPYPIDKANTIRYLIGQPLQHDPGTKFSYCNFGYMLLGEILEKVTGKPYESYVRAHVLEPAGVSGIRLGHTLLKDRAPMEVHYYTYRDARPAKSVFDAKGVGARSDVGFSMENIAAAGGWIASAPDLARFMVAIDGFPRQRDVLSAEIEAIRNTNPDLPAVEKPANTEPAADNGKPAEFAPSWYYGNGLFVRTLPQQTNFWHGGSLSGTATMMRWSTSGLGWIVLLNGRPKNKGFDSEVGAMVLKALQGMRRFPDGDLFQFYKPAYKE